MEQSFWFIFIGLTVFTLHKIFTARSFALLWLIDPAAGTGAGALIGLLRDIHIGYDRLPVWFAALLGGLAALMLFLADRSRLFSTDGLKYSALIILSLIHSGIAFMIYKQLLFTPVPDYLPQPLMAGIYIQLLLISALSMVGFTMPKRLSKATESALTG